MAHEPPGSSLSCSARRLPYLVRVQKWLANSTSSGRTRHVGSPSGLRPPNERTIAVSTRNSYANSLRARYGPVFHASEGVSGREVRTPLARAAVCIVGQNGNGAGLGFLLPRFLLPRFFEVLFEFRHRGEALHRETQHAKHIRSDAPVTRASSRQAMIAQYRIATAIATPKSAATPPKPSTEFRARSKSSESVP